MGTHWIDEGCINYSACAEVCPVDAISEQSEVHVINMDTYFNHDFPGGNRISPLFIDVFDI